MARVFAAAGVWGRKETETDGGAAAAALKREGVLAFLLLQRQTQRGGERSIDAVAGGPGALDGRTG